MPLAYKDPLWGIISALASCCKLMIKGLPARGRTSETKPVKAYMQNASAKYLNLFRERRFVRGQEKNRV